MKPIQTAAKAWRGGIVSGVAGLLLPGVTYLLTVDGNGISGNEWLHAALLAIAGAAAAGGATASVVYWTSNDPKQPAP